MILKSKSRYLPLARWKTGLSTWCGRADSFQQSDQTFRSSRRNYKPARWQKLFNSTKFQSALKRIRPINRKKHKYEFFLKRVDRYNLVNDRYLVLFHLGVAPALGGDGGGILFHFLNFSRHPSER